MIVNMTEENRAIIEKRAKEFLENYNEGTYKHVGTIAQQIVELIVETVINYTRYYFDTPTLYEKFKTIYSLATKLYCFTDSISEHDYDTISGIINFFTH